MQAPWESQFGVVATVVVVTTDRMGDIAVAATAVNLGGVGGSLTRTAALDWAVGGAVGTCGVLVVGRDRVPWMVGAGGTRGVKGNGCGARARPQPLLRLRCRWHSVDSSLATILRALSGSVCWGQRGGTPTRQRRSGISSSIPASDTPTVLS